MAGIIKKQILKHLSSDPCLLWWSLICYEYPYYQNECQKLLRNHGNRPLAFTRNRGLLPEFLALSVESQEARIFHL